MCSHEVDTSTWAVARQSEIMHQNGAPGFECILVPGVPTKTRLESSVKKFKPILVYNWGFQAVDEGVGDQAVDEEGVGDREERVCGLCDSHCHIGDLTATIAWAKGIRSQVRLAIR